MPSLQRLTKTLRESPVVRLNGYDYFVHPLTDGIPTVPTALLQEVVDALKARLPKGVEKILTAEAMGIPIAAGLSLATGIPFTVARKRRYGLPDEVVVTQRTGYGGSNLHVHGLAEGERILLLDDVVSTGGTLRALATACRQARATIVGARVVVNKSLDLGALTKDVGAPVEALVTLRVQDGRVKLEGA